MPVEFYNGQMKPLLNTIIIMFFIGFPIRSPTKFDHKPQLLDVPNHVPSQTNQIYINHNTLLAKHYQKAGSLRAASFLKLDITASNLLTSLAEKFGSCLSKKDGEMLPLRFAFQPK